MNKKQIITIAIMAVIGLLLAAFILKPRGEAASGTSEHAAAASASASASATPTSTLAAGKLEALTLNEAQIRAAGIVMATAGPAQIATILTLPGEIRFNEDRTAHVVPKLAGVVTAVHAELGQTVQRGQLLAVLASSALSEQRSELLSAQRRLALASTTLERERKLWQDKISAEQDYLQARQAMSEADIAVQNARQKLRVLGASAVAGARPLSADGISPGAQLSQLELRAPFAGVVMEKHLALGEAVKEDANVFTIADLSTVWADFAVPPQDLTRVRVGETAVVRATALNAQVNGKISYVGALLGEQTRTAKARVVLANPKGAWRPGLFVDVDVNVTANANANANANVTATATATATTTAAAEEAAAGSDGAALSVTVLADAVQTVDGKPSIFVRTAQGFQVQPVTLGRSDGKLTEVLQGLPAGARYAAANSYLLKAELGKDSAEHAH
jgi:cobalt-zinc-cadmium efflux system membrane fusion protein